jgi:ArsR family transcriptional regulator, lead/cadmium/zinc/bismuth-responsive transcriptional repressor
MSENALGQSCQQHAVHGDALGRAGARLLDDGAYLDLAQLFGAMADSTRARIVHLLLHDELCTCDLAALLGVTDSCVSQHLRVLRSLRLVKSRRAGKFVYYSLDDAHIALLVQVGLTHLGHAQGTAIEQLAARAVQEA